MKRLLRTLGPAALVIGVFSSTASAQPVGSAAPKAAPPAASAPPAGSAPAGAPAGAPAASGAKPPATPPATSSATPPASGSGKPPASAAGAPAAPPSSGTAAPTASPTDAGSAAANPTSSSQAPTTTAPDGSQVDGATYAVRLRDLEQRIDELKEQIRRSHTRLSLLSDTILSGGGAGSRAVIRFSNELSDAFRVTRLLFVVDGAVQYNKTDQSGALSEQEQIPIFNGTIPPGDHSMQVLVNLQGHGYGVFSYLRGYRFEVRSSHSFTAVDGKTMNLDAVAYEKGGVTTPLEERPAIRYREKVSTGLADTAASPAAATK